MRVDKWRLYVMGGMSGNVYIYNKFNAKLVAVVNDGLPAGKTALNDAVFVGNTLYVTDSYAPILWKLVSWNGKYQLQKVVDFTGTAFVYTPGQFNADGIVASPDGRYLLISNVYDGKLYRVDLVTKKVSFVDIGALVPGADGLHFLGDEVYIAQNAANKIWRVELAADFSSGWVDTITTSPSFDFTVAIAPVGDRLLVLNSQFEHLFAPPGQTPTPPTLPFWISNIKLP